MKNTISISKTILDASIKVQLGENIEKIEPKEMIDLNDIYIVDRDLLLIFLKNILGIKVIYENRNTLIETKKKIYTADEFLIKFFANGRKELYKGVMGDVL